MIRGCDVSHWESVSDWKALVECSSFAFFKATEGIEVRDPSFYPNWQNAKDNGLIRGPYHYWSPYHDGPSQAEFFHKVVGDLDPTDLPPVLDLEANNNDISKINVKDVYDFLVSCEAWFGRVPQIYGNPTFLNALNLPNDFKRYPLWVAEYLAKEPLVPRPWTKWSFWQSDDRAKISGIGVADLDFFNGSLGDLNVFILASHTRGD